MKKNILILIVAFCICCPVFSQSNIGIGTTAPNINAILDLTATDKGFLIPRLNNTERNSITINPAADIGLLVFDTDDSLFYYWKGNVWVPFPQAPPQLSFNNISLNFDTITQILSLTDNGGTLSTVINFNNFDEDKDSTNELISSFTYDSLSQNLTIVEAGVNWNTTLNINDADADPTNEIQNLNLNGNILGLTLSNITVDLSPYLDNTDNQILTLNGDSLSISNGNSVDLSGLGNDWKLLGNGGTVQTTNFLGTTDNVGLTIRTNNLPRLTVTNTGDVGIGTTTPNVKLQVNGNVSVGIENPINTGTLPGYGNFLNFNGGPAGGTFGSSNSDPFWIARYNVASDNSELRVNIGDNPLQAANQDLFSVGATDGSGWQPVFNVRSGGNVGIGTTIPQFKLEVEDGAINLSNETFSVFWGTTFSNGISESGHFVGRRARGTKLAPQYSLSGDVLVAFQGRSFLMPTPGAWAGISIVAAENHGPNNQGAEVQITSVPNGTLQTLTRIFVKQDGRVGIGTGNPDQLLSVNGNASKPGGGTWAALSDIRLKKDIKDFSDGLEVIMNLQPVSFSYKANSGFSDLNQEYIGFIAQEVEKAAPYMVQTINDQQGISGLTDKKMLDESALTKILVNAIKEQQAIIDFLKNEKIAALEKNNEDLTSAIQSLKNEISDLKTYIYSQAKK